jgi:hypothetical protein
MIPAHRPNIPGYVRHTAWGMCNRCYLRSRTAWGCGQDIDAVAVERAANPHWPCPPLNAAELREAVRVLTDRKWSTKGIAARLNIWPRSVTRIRTELREARRAAA